jgi:hypothetical protein
MSRAGMGWRATVRPTQAQLEQVDRLDRSEPFCHSRFRVLNSQKAIFNPAKIVHRVVWTGAYSYDTSTSWTDTR